MRLALQAGHQLGFDSWRQRVDRAIRSRANPPARPRGRRDTAPPLMTSACGAWERLALSSRNDAVGAFESLWQRGLSWTDCSIRAQRALVSGSRCGIAGTMSRPMRVVDDVGAILPGEGNAACFARASLGRRWPGSGEWACASSIWPSSNCWLIVLRKPASSWISLPSCWSQQTSAAWQAGERRRRGGLVAGRAHARESEVDAVIGRSLGDEALRRKTAGRG